MTGANAPNQSATAQAGEELEYNFPQPGMYDIAVVGEYDEGTLLKQRSVQAECKRIMIYSCILGSHTKQRYHRVSIYSKNE